MENSNNNRYELLFMDDDGNPTVAPLKSVLAAGTGKKKPATQQNVNANKVEKENKPILLNKNNVQVSNGMTVKTKNAHTLATKETRTRVNPSRFEGTVKHYSGQTEYNSELPQRQFKDRDNKGLQSSRFRGTEKFGKREFDRQSGSDKTGIKSVDKREGGGAHNWGSAKQDIEDIKSGEPAQITEKEESGNEQPGDGAQAEEDESKQMTLDEWKAMQEQRAKPNYNLRKAGEGVDNSEWKKMVVLSKKKNMENEDELEYDPSLYPQRVGRLQRIVDIQFNFNDGRKSGFRKGFRPPPRSGLRQEPVSDNGYQKSGPPKFDEKRRVGSKSLKVDDEAQFPTLS
ncbi:CG41503 [Drosophila busckii]|uniref:CG41503 n=1 Tax=Drosophila busckii TaxID=30019 RepID=A0A0M4EPZ0_DROBS|nr:plasminogen activator inhibitor 1 RNA-binding protein [Drosophila busckii]ALC47927.1 CG41503 [Drosophila busckii]